MPHRPRRRHSGSGIGAAMVQCVRDPTPSACSVYSTPRWHQRFLQAPVRDHLPRLPPGHRRIGCRAARSCKLPGLGLDPLLLRLQPCPLGWRPRLRWLHSGRSVEGFGAPRLRLLQEALLPESRLPPRPATRALSRASRCGSSQERLPRWVAAWGHEDGCLLEHTRAAAEPVWSNLPHDMLV